MHFQAAGDRGRRPGTRQLDLCGRRHPLLPIHLIYFPYHWYQWTKRGLVDSSTPSILRVGVYNFVIVFSTHVRVMNGLQESDVI